MDAPRSDAPRADAPAPMVAFAPKVDFPTGGNPQGVLFADFNGDGVPDLVTADTNDNTVSVLLGTSATGAAPPTFAPRVTFPTGVAPVAIGIADFDGDGTPDLAVANVAANTISVLLDTTVTGALAPTFAAAVDFATGANPEYVVAADFTGDGVPDLAVANVGASTVSLLVGTTHAGSAGSAAPSFAAKVDIAAGDGAVSVAAGDLDGDGKPDLAVANLRASTVSLLRNTTAAGATVPTFGAAVTAATGMTPNSVALADLNRDGKLDLVVANAEGNTVSLLLNTTAAGAAAMSVAPKVDFATDATPNYVAIADLDGNGTPDLAIAEDGAAALSIVLDTTPAGAATPTVSSLVDYAVDATPRSAAIADVNGDGMLDIAVANTGAATVSLLLGR